jgi:hypothetical protein
VGAAIAPPHPAQDVAIARPRKYRRGGGVVAPSIPKGYAMTLTIDERLARLLQKRARQMLMPRVRRTERTCPHCGKTSTPSAISKHAKVCRSAPKAVAAPPTIERAASAPGCQ